MEGRSRNKKGVSIVSLSHLYPEQIGGAEIFAFRLSKGLHNKNHFVRIMATCRNLRVVEEYRRMGVQVVCGVPTSKLPLPQDVLRFAVSIALQSLSMLLYEIVSGMDAFLCFGSEALIIGYPLSRLLRKRCVVRYSGGELHAINRQPQSSKERWQKKLFQLGLLLSRKVEACVVTADWELDFLSLHGIPKTRIVKIQNGVDPIAVRVSKVRDNRRLQLIHVGRFAREFYSGKRIEMLVSAFSKFKEVYPLSTLTLVGDGPGVLDIVRQVRALGLANSIEFAGSVKHEEVFEYLRRSDIFVFPSLAEGMSNALMEAVLTGVPVVASDTPPNREILQDVPASILFDPDSSSSLLSALVEMATDLSRRKEEAGESALKLASRYSFDRTVELYEKVLFQ